MRNHLSPSIALGIPRSAEDRLETVKAVEDARAGRRAVEVRIGVGALEGEVPARVLAHADCVVEALWNLRQIIGDRPFSVRIFSSAMKLGNKDVAAIIPPLAALAGALQLAGLEAEIRLQAASETTEIVRSVELSASHFDWVRRRAFRYGTSTEASLRYALEHASPSMFGDITDGDYEQPLRITVGGAMEARFWAVRMMVRAAERAAGNRVTPALALIMKAVKVPWYSPTFAEPRLHEVLDPDAAIAAINSAANPKKGGNPGLNREARAFSRAVRRAGIQELATSVSSIEGSKRFIERFQVCHRLLTLMHG